MSYNNDVLSRPPIWGDTQSIAPMTEFEEPIKQQQQIQRTTKSAEHQKPDGEKADVSEQSNKKSIFTKWLKIGLIVLLVLIFIILAVVVIVWLRKKKATLYALGSSGQTSLYIQDQGSDGSPLGLGPRVNNQTPGRPTEATTEEMLRQKLLHQQKEQLKIQEAMLQQEQQKKLAESEEKKKLEEQKQEQLRLHQQWQQQQQTNEQKEESKANRKPNKKIPKQKKQKKTKKQKDDNPPVQQPAVPAQQINTQQAVKESDDAKNKATTDMVNLWRKLVHANDAMNENHIKQLSDMRNTEKEKQSMSNTQTNQQSFQQQFVQPQQPQTGFVMKNTKTVKPSPLKAIISKKQTQQIPEQKYEEESDDSTQTNESPRSDVNEETEEDDDESSPEHETIRRNNKSAFRPITKPSNENANTDEDLNKTAYMLQKVKESTQEQKTDDNDDHVVIMK